MSECELCLYHWEKFYIRGTSIGPKCRDPLTLREFWDHKRWNSGKKKAIFGVIWRGSGEIWDSATPPTYIWDQCPKKTRFLGSPYAILILLISRCTSGSESCYNVSVLDGRGKSRWQRGCISQYLPSFGGIRSFYSSSGSARDKLPSIQGRIHIVKSNSSL